MEKIPKPTEGRLVSKNEVDMSLLKRWLHTCDNVHPYDDPSPGNWAVAASFLRVIDVQRQCIVKAPRKCRYMALSYYEKKPCRIGEAKWTVHGRQKAAKNDCRYHVGRVSIRRAISMG